MSLRDLLSSKRTLYLIVSFIVIASVGIVLVLLFPEKRYFFHTLASRIFRNL
jgi:hypothetical membrane protein